MPSDAYRVENLVQNAIRTGGVFSWSACEPFALRAIHFDGVWKMIRPQYQRSSPSLKALGRTR